MTLLRQLSALAVYLHGFSFTLSVAEMIAGAVENVVVGGGVVE